jgi:hypothetical protein
MTHADEHRPPWAGDRLSVALRAARAALGRATAVFLGDEGDDGMKAAGQALHELRGEIEELVPDPSALPAASHTRTTVAVVHLGGDLERLADLTQQIAEIAWSRQSSRPLPEHLRSAVEAMSGEVLGLVERAGETALLERAAAMDAAAGLERELGTVAGRQRFLDEALAAADPPVDDASVVDLALLGRCYEGCAQHAVSAVRHVAELAS